MNPNWPPSENCRQRPSAGILAVVARVLVGCACVSAADAAEPEIQFKQSPGRIDISIGDDTVASYFSSHEDIPRPFLAHVKAPGGIQVTRNHPPVPGKDDLDHGTMGTYFHPGIWLAFADINGNDYWRLKAPVVDEGVVDGPTGGGGSGSFTVRHSYRRQDDPDEIVCTELCRYTVEATADGYLIVVDSLLWPNGQDIVIGDQEEMGLGVRVATPMAVKHGGRMVDAMGRTNEDEIWGHEAAWCDYSGIVEGKPVGVLLVPDPTNVRASRFHARDYGVLVANPFGRKVFGEKEESRFVVGRDDSLRLQFGILLHSESPDRQLDLGPVAERITKRMAQLPRPTK